LTAQGSLAGFPSAESDVAGLTIGGQVRVRGYTLENMWDLDGADDGDRWSVLRNRARLFARAELPRGVRGFVRLANQNWGAGVTDADTTDRWEADNKSGKLFVDAAWLELTGAFGLPVDVRCGRQDLVYGNGFVLCDGQSHLASTANYLDGVRLAVSPHAAWSLDLLYFKEQERQRSDAAPDDVTLMGAYLAHREPDGEGAGDLYLLRREDQGLGKDVLLYGARVAGRLGATLDYSLEGGLQRGDLAPAVRQEAWGGKAEIGFAPQGAPAGLRPYLGFVGLSGDDAGTPATGERWDVYYGGWPQFGDLLAWTYLNLGGGNAVTAFDPAYAVGSNQSGEVVYGNLLMPTAGVDLHPCAGLEARVSFSRLRAHRVLSGSDAIGDYYQLRMRYAYSPQLSLGLYAALLAPGDAYGPGADTAHELYWETLLKF